MHSICRKFGDELRRKINDAQSNLPPGCYPSFVKDDFGDVYGVFLAITGQGYSYAELKDHANFLQKELLQVKDVARVEIWGTQKECIIVEISRAHVAESNIHPQQVVEILQQQNLVVEAGSLDAGTQRIRLTPTGTFRGVEEIGDLVVRGKQGELSLLRDVAKIYRGYVDPPEKMMRFNGKPAIGIAISNVSGSNVVTMGENVKKKLKKLEGDLPLGINVETVSFQSETVRKAVNGFIENLIESVLIVIVVLLVTMGWRSGIIIGSGLIFTILATFIVMSMMRIDLQRTSLGALIIAMGMLVDNAIVVTEGGLIRLQLGHSRRDSVIQPAKDTAWPLLGATLVALIAFLPIYISENNTGEYCASMFLVIAISLFISWIFAMTLTPVSCELFLKIDEKKTGKDPYAGWIYRFYDRMLQVSLRNSALVMTIMLILFLSAGFGMRYVKRIFFPKSTRDQFMIDYWKREGTRIQDVSKDLKKLEKFLHKLEGVKSTATCIGAGPPRFYLPYEPELPNSSYGQIIINVSNPEKIDKLIPKVEVFLKDNFLSAEPRIRRFPLGPSEKFKVEARFSGPDPKILRMLSQKAQEIMRQAPYAKDVRDDWRQKTKKWIPAYSQPRARRTMVTRYNMAKALQRMTSGLPVGYYRENDEIMTILLKASQREITDTSLSEVPVWGVGNTSVPLKNIVSTLKLSWENPIIRRRNRKRCITAQCDPVDPITANELRNRLKKQIEEIHRPSGYTLEWGGEFESSQKARKTLFSKLPLTFLLMSLIVVALFNAFRQPLIIFLTLPLSLIGIAPGLIFTGQPFGFMALLGALSLSGMLIKNAVVLLDQIDAEIRFGKDPYRAVVESSVSRMRPVMMASMTTVLAMIPLISDKLFGAMAVTIMFGLTCATILILIVVPVLYSAFFKIQKANLTQEEKNDTIEK